MLVKTNNKNPKNQNEMTDALSHPVHSQVHTGAPGKAATCSFLSMVVSGCWATRQPFLRLQSCVWISFMELPFSTLSPQALGKGL